MKGKRQPTLRGRYSKTSREKPLPSVAAVEIDAPGCSYNPEYEQHQVGKDPDQGEMGSNYAHLF